MAEIVSMKILSIIPAAPGWKAEFLSEKTAEYAVPVACWALVQYEDAAGNATATEVLPVTPCQDESTPKAMWVGAWDYTGDFDLSGIVAPGEEYPRQGRYDAEHKGLGGGKEQ